MSLRHDLQQKLLPTKIHQQTVGFQVTAPRAPRLGRPRPDGMLNFFGITSRSSSCAGNRKGMVVVVVVVVVVVFFFFGGGGDGAKWVPFLQDEM